MKNATKYCECSAILNLNGKQGIALRSNAFGT